MPVTPAGMFGLPYVTLEAMLSELEGFQTWVDADDATEALDSIFMLDAGGGAITANRVTLGVMDGFESLPLDTGGNFRDSGSMLVLFEEVAAAADTPMRDSFLSFLNNVGGILEELQLAAPSRWTHLRISLDEGPHICDEAEGVALDKPYVWAGFRISWGFD